MSVVVYLAIFLLTATFTMNRAINKQSFEKHDEKIKKEIKEAEASLSFGNKLEIARNRYFSIYGTYPTNIQDMIDKELLPTNFSNSKYSSKLSLVDGAVSLDTTNSSNEMVADMVVANTGKIISENNLVLSNQSQIILNRNNKLATITKTKDYNNYQVTLTNEIKTQFDTAEEQNTLTVSSVVDDRQLQLDSSTIKKLGGW